MEYKKAIASVVMSLCLLQGACVGTSPDLTNPQHRAEFKEIIILMHGFGRNNLSMWKMKQRFQDEGYVVKSVGYGSWGRTPEEVLNEITPVIGKIFSDNQQTIHFVGHSLGGLLIRVYLTTHHPEHLGRVVLIGSPNKGTPVVDLYRDRWWMKAAGDTALSLGSDLAPMFRSLPEPDYELGVIAGISDNTLFSKTIPGNDDGLVPVLSTRIVGMKDFAIVQSNHTMMRYNIKVADLTVEFLRQGCF